MPLILRQVFGSEKFIYTAVLFMLPITVFTAMGLMSVDDWRHDALWALGMLISGKTLQGVADRIGAPRAAAPPADQTIGASVTVNVPNDSVTSQTTQPMDATTLSNLLKKPPPQTGIIVTATPQPPDLPGGVIVGRSAPRPPDPPGGVIQQAVPSNPDLPGGIIITRTAQPDPPTGVIMAHEPPPPIRSGDDS